MEENTPRKEPETSFSGLYKNVKISVKTLDKVIIGGIILMVVLVFFGIANNGYTITFDSNGGTDIPPQELMYGDYVTEPEPPTREGYTFGGWFMDENCNYPWDMAQSTVSESTTLHALWIKDTE